MKANIGALAVAAASVLAAGCAENKAKKPASPKQPESVVLSESGSSSIRVLPPPVQTAIRAQLPKYRYSGPSLKGSLSQPTRYRDRSVEIFAIGRKMGDSYLTWRADGQIVRSANLFDQAAEEWSQLNGSEKRTRQADENKKDVWILVRVDKDSEPTITLEGEEAKYSTLKPLSPEGGLLFLYFVVDRNLTSAEADMLDIFPASGETYTMSLNPGSTAGPVKVVDAEIFKTKAQPGNYDIEDLRVAFSLEEDPFSAFLEVEVKGSGRKVLATDNPAFATPHVSLFTPGRETHSLRIPPPVKAPLYAHFRYRPNPTAEIRLKPISRIRFADIALEPRPGQ